MNKITLITKSGAIACSRISVLVVAKFATDVVMRNLRIGPRLV